MTTDRAIVSATQTIFIPAGHPLLATVKAPRAVAVAAPAAPLARSRWPQSVDGLVALAATGFGFGLGKLALILFG